MSFAVTYRAILDNNIRNIYGGVPCDGRILLRPPYIQPPLHGRIKDLLPAKTTSWQRRTTVFVPEFSTRIPKAPSLKAVLQNEMAAIVERVSRPTTAKALYCQPEEDISFDLLPRTQTAPAKIRMVTQAEQTAILQRLSRPTVSSLGRSKMNKKDFASDEITDASKKTKRNTRSIPRRSKTFTIDCRLPRRIVFISDRQR